jgi:hypothetical protein
MTQPWDHSTTFSGHVASWHQTPQDYCQALQIEPTPLNWQPLTTIYATIDSGKTLPNPNSKKIPLTPEEVALIEDLFNDFGGTISDRVLQYLVRWLGASELTAARIRCLYQNGYLSLPSSVYTSAALESNYESALNAIVNHLDPNDLEGAWKDANPGEVDPATIKDPRYVSGADHLKETKEALKSIRSFIISVDNKVKYLNDCISRAPDPNTSYVLEMINQKAHLHKLKDVFTRLSNFVQSKRMKGSPSPDTWLDRGKVPVIEDLLQVSPCTVPGPQYYK